ncbi:hypothetical protein Ciccas_011591 [Cichlidogyrus casuarinus]|uniref:Uncharacterized protein n=1 Tax=Cichlidogyrus casuarinus TaxID=1844966 RepID=A0ABD2PSX9_9PLAT
MSSMNKEPTRTIQHLSSLLFASCLEQRNLAYQKENELARKQVLFYKAGIDPAIEMMAMKCRSIVPGIDCIWLIKEPENRHMIRRVMLGSRRFAMFAPSTDPDSMIQEVAAHSCI